MRINLHKGDIWVAVSELKPSWEIGTMCIIEETQLNINIGGIYTVKYLSGKYAKGLTLFIPEYFKNTSEHPAIIKIYEIMERYSTT